MTRSPLPEDYPNLFRPVTWGAISRQFQGCASPPPHPEFYRVVGWGEVEVHNILQNPEDGEQVAAVNCVCVEEASQRFLEDSRLELAESYRLVAAMRQSFGQ
jgi:hypothetical protein